MAATPPVGRKGNAMGPPKKGYAVQYERLLVEELSLKNAQAKFLNPEQSRARSGDDSSSLEAAPVPPATNDELKIRGMIHRASLKGMLIAAKDAASEAKLNPASSSEYERGLERPEAKNALEALRLVKARQLEEEDCQIPLNIGLDSMEWRRKLSTTIIQSMGHGTRGSDTLEANADDFFSMFPECRRRDGDASCFSEFDESESDDDESIDIPKPKAKKKKESKKGGGSDEVLVVSCSSTSPSPERLAEKQREPIHNQQKQPQPQPQPQPSNLPRNGVTQHPQNSSMNESVMHASQQPQRPTNIHPNNPYQQQNQRGSHQHQQQNGHSQQNAYQNQTSAFDYNDNTQNNMGMNAFRTAKEGLATEFNGKPQGGNNGGGRHGKCNNEWDKRTNTGDNYASNNYQRRMGNNGGMNNRSTSSAAPGGPQHMVQTALQGPKHNMSAGLGQKFRNPMARGSNNGQQNGNNGQHQGNSNGMSSNSTNNGQVGGGAGAISGNGNNEEDELPEELRHFDKKLVEMIDSEIVDSGEKITFDHIAGLQNAKAAVYEMIIMPMKRPDMFTGLRATPKGMLLFGPPGTGKTLIGKGKDFLLSSFVLYAVFCPSIYNELCLFLGEKIHLWLTFTKPKAIAHESGATFFSISSSSLTSKWIGEGEKLVKTLFAVASYRAPSVIFIDEVDSLLTQRKADENEASRRIKTEFLVALDGAKNERQQQVLVIGATNLPQELDDAARRRFVKKLYIPLPDEPSRASLIKTLLTKNNNKHSLTEKDILKLAKDTEGFSGADVKNLCVDAAMGPIRRLNMREMMNTSVDDLPPISYKHFRSSLRGMSPSVAQADLAAYIEWNNTYGNKVSNVDDSYESDTGDESESS